MTKKVPPGDAQALIDAVEQFLHDEALDALEGYTKFRARVALAHLRMLRRELDAGQSATARANEDAAKLAGDIRGRRVDWRDRSVFEAVRSRNRARLEIDNPKWIW